MGAGVGSFHFIYIFLEDFQSGRQGVEQPKIGYKISSMDYFHFGSLVEQIWMSFREMPWLAIYQSDWQMSSLCGITL